MKIKLWCCSKHWWSLQLSPRVPTTYQRWRQLQIIFFILLDKSASAEDSLHITIIMIFESCVFIYRRLMSQFRRSSLKLECLCSHVLHTANTLSMAAWLLAQLCVYLCACVLVCHRCFGSGCEGFSQWQSAMSSTGHSWSSTAVTWRYGCTRICWCIGD